jgi:hypothetical protein
MLRKASEKKESAAAGPVYGCKCECVKRILIDLQERAVPKKPAEEEKAAKSCSPRRLSQLG